ncbi:hypothetical protein [Pontibacter fetidus]|uniref:DUF3575 domain-containing protein n=1 Tax=Pontibacter fetidus TaxID=2700082 RepID=A0A6B2GXQ9_9BACT|nr:hypothetical protein [Pontibacter fetidus]NDK55739.1 hypothetical protein [Pontibacter fetidus]
MKKLLITALTLLLFTAAQAQTEKPTQAWEVEVDPIAFFLKGYSAHVIYQPDRVRLDVGVFGVQQPESFHGNKGFNLMTQGFGLKASYLLQGTTGFYTGLGAGYTFNEATHKESGVEETGKTIGVGTHIGYRFFFQKDEDGTPKGLYITPWVSLDYNIHIDKIKFEGNEFKQDKFGVFPTVHVGYRF